MKRLLLLLFLLVAPAVLAATELLLRDGQVLQGTRVRRESDIYVVELESGGAITIPVSLVLQVRLVADAETDTDSRASNGLTTAEPQQLAGEVVRPLTPSESQEALGEPSRFRPSIVDPNWRPESGFPDKDVLAGSRSEFREDIVDNSWEPQSGFSGKDALEGSRSTFQKSIVDNSWAPEDGFRRKKTFWNPEQARAATGGAAKRMTSIRTLSDARTPTRADVEWAKVIEQGGWFRPSPFAPGSDYRFRFKVQPTGRSVRSASVGDCAENVLQATGAPTTVETEKVDDARYAELPIDLFASTTTAGDEVQRAVFTVAGGQCRAISGDLTDLLRVGLTRDHALAHGVQAYNAALGDRIAVELTTDEAKIGYAFAVISLVDPAVNGHERESLLLLPDKDALRELTRTEAKSCSVSGSARKKAKKKAEKSYAPPRVVAGEQGELVEFFSWSSLDGMIVRHAAYLSADGKVSLDREIVATHVGDHRDRD